MPATLRVPPAPYREKAFAQGPGFCCVCGQRVYQFGWHIDLWSKGPNKRATWHCACVIAWQFWNAPSEQAALLRRLQARRCGQTGGRLWKNGEVDHRMPLYRVWNEHRNMRWPDLLGYWGLPNLQVINRDAHVLKCADEARDRKLKRSLTAKDSLGRRIAPMPSRCPDAEDVCSGVARGEHPELVSRPRHVMTSASTYFARSASRNWRRMIFPVVVIGSAATNSTSRGTSCLAK